MSVVETVLIFVGIPVAIYLVLAALTLGPGRTRASRYRPGQPWNHGPVWFAAQDRTAAPVGSRPIVPGAAVQAAGSGTLNTARGGAHGSW